MTPAEILNSLSPTGHQLTADGDLSFGTATALDGTMIHVISVGGGSAIGIDEAIRLADHVLKIAFTADASPIMLLIDTSSQRMSRRDELLGLSEYLAHLAKSLLLAETRGHRTVGLLYGGSAAGAFIATALACGTLVALPGAHPEVMDLPSMARVTKLPIDVLKEKAKATPVFAPGLENLAQTGAIAETWDPELPLADQLAALLARPRSGDDRAALGNERGGRLKAEGIVDEIVTLARERG
ncbi:biotin-independent malonate decarboxylase subunit gamma [Agrobacterium sp. rho-13.3]|uniref:biotin-independent malonate decarboxylase subunit gamma n=1 Tax=Agrobacterium sp. rho-13.3 TaxID=3072980 RepID=UPI002A165969|nr:biotin-independent malonate decarboxylase subunit gamma [Agrobacterium sp. rho-13.3]MDX8308476.1 biotin-independent malonate decarboxylase subunit gamma [Agrobacterium sp. rho-13.3]